MKKLIFFGIFLLCYSLNAKVFFGEKIKIKNIQEEVFAFGERIDASGNFGNEFIGIGKNLNSEVAIKGDYIGIGLNHVLKCKAENDIYLLGNNIILSGNIKGSLTALGKNISLNCNVAKNIRILGEKIFLNSVVSGNTVLWGENVSIEGSFKNLVIHSNKINLNGKTVVLGNFTYYSNKKLNSDMLEVKGNIIWKKSIKKTLTEKFPLFKLKVVYNFLSLLFPFLFMLWLTPNLLSQTAMYSGKKFFHCFLLGLLFILFILIFVPVIFITVIGIPFGLIVGSIFLSFIYISRVFPFIYISRKIFFKLPEKKVVWFLSTFTGVLIYVILSQIPDLKLIINLFTIPSGFGSLILGRIDLYKKLRSEKFL